MEKPDKTQPAPLKNCHFHGHQLIPYTNTVVDVRETKNSGLYDVFVILEGRTHFYHYPICVAVSIPMHRPLRCIGGYNSLALRIAGQGELKIEPTPNPYRMRLTLQNEKIGFKASVLVPKISIISFFYEDVLMMKLSPIGIGARRAS
ncbi:MAG: hypothetical protein ACOYUZ_02690 [Patescibacteria group bacterium]